ncbi:MAG TPA: hypothetical protein VM925_03205 [Labilithrix sp.]|nr:hypothetical protein [Labilithrix sp.]
MTKARVILGASAFFVTSFLMSGNGNVLPQLFFQRFYPDRKVVLLAACLFVGTCGGIAGVLVSRRTELGRTRALVIVLATLGAEAALFFLRDALTYVALNAVAQFGANYLTNQVDHAAVTRGAPEHRRLYDGASNVARLFGILAAPAFFTRFVGQTIPVLAILTAATGIALASAGSVATLPARQAVTGVDVTAGKPLRALEPADRLLFGYAAGVYVALYLFAANLIYLLRDVLHVEDAVRRGGTAIVVVFFSALVANALAASLRGTSEPRRPALAAPVGVLAVAAAVMLRGETLPFAVVLGGCAVVGTTYGVFLAEVRDHASRGARDHGKIELLTLFNNLGNVSSLIAFGVMVVLAATLHGSGTHRWVLGIIGILPVAVLPLLFASTALRAPGKR